MLQVENVSKSFLVDLVLGHNVLYKDDKKWKGLFELLRIDGGSGNIHTATEVRVGRNGDCAKISFTHVFRARVAPPRVVRSEPEPFEGMAGDVLHFSEEVKMRISMVGSEGVKLVFFPASCSSNTP